GVMLDNGQWKTIRTVASWKLPLEVGGPQIIRCRAGDRRGARMLPVPTTATRLNQSAALQQVPDGTGGRPVLLRPPFLEPRQQLPRSPARVLPARLHDAGGGHRVDAMGAVMRGAAPFRQAGRPVGLVPIQPFVARATANAIALTQL